MKIFYFFWIVLLLASCKLERTSRFHRQKYTTFKIVHQDIDYQHKKVERKKTQKNKNRIDIIPCKDQGVSNPNDNETDTTQIDLFTNTNTIDDLLPISKGCKKAKKEKPVALNLKRNPLELKQQRQVKEKILQSDHSIQLNWLWYTLLFLGGLTLYVFGIVLVYGYGTEFVFLIILAMILWFLPLLHAIFKLKKSPDEEYKTRKRLLNYAIVIGSLAVVFFFLQILAR